MASSITQTVGVPAAQAKLVLQDPRIWDEAQVPPLKLSQELAIDSASEIDRKVLQKSWEALQLKHEDIIFQNVQLRDANTNVEIAIKQTNSARSELVQVQAKLQQLQDTRWQHPAVYTAGAAILGLGCLWFFERKKRIAAQEYTELLLSESHSFLERPEGPLSDSQPLEDQALLKAKNVVLPAIETPQGLLVSQESPLEAPFKAPFEVATPWWSRKRRLSPTERATVPLVAKPLPTDQNADVKFYDGDTEIKGTQDPAKDLYISSIKSEQLEPVAVTQVSSKDAMAYLLEIRMRVQTFYALEQPHSAHQLLEQHIAASPHTCAWAYMEYMDLSAKLGLRDAFEAMRTRYRLQFNRLAPYWMEPNASVQRLDSYERPITELCAAWPMQDRSKALLATWLLGNLHSRRLFQLPAYHDLLDLYEMLEFYNLDFIEAQDFVPTVSLLELDYEFAVEVKLDASSIEDALRAIPTVKPGDFAVDFNLAHNTTQQGALEPFN